MDVTRSQPKMQELSSAECYEALASHLVGRIGVIVDQYPLIIPVNYVVDDNSVVIRTAPGTVLSHADRARITFQVDEFDAVTKSGWSVLLRGEGHVESAADQITIPTGVADAELSSWAPGERPIWIRIHATDITGRRIVPGNDREWRLTSMAYL